MNVMNDICGDLVVSKGAAQQLIVGQQHVLHEGARGEPPGAGPPGSVCTQAIALDAGAGLSDQSSAQLPHLVACLSMKFTSSGGLCCRIRSWKQTI